MSRSVLALAVVGMAASAGAEAASDTVKLTYLPTGAMPKMGGYMPQRLELSADKPTGLTNAPEMASPLFGTLKVGPGDGFVVAVDEPDGGPARLFVDANGNGDLTDDAAAEWKPRESGRAEGPKYTMWMGGATVSLAGETAGDAVRDAHLGMYRFDKSDPSREALKNALLYYSDYAYEGKVTLGEGTFDAMLTDDMASGDFRGAEGDSSGVRLLIDANANGRFDSRGEAFDVRKPFNIKGVTYEVKGMTAAGSAFEIGRSVETVAEILPPPDLSPGQKALEFKAETTAGALVNFPSTYAGKVVMLDFWAMWCGPCIGEIPNMVEAYAKYHDKGFEVLAISMDRKGDGEKLKKFTEEHAMPWAQVFDGGEWQAAVAVQYGVDSIPRAFLVDGDTGEIIAGGDEIRGENLGPAVERALAKKSKK